MGLPKKYEFVYGSVKTYRTQHGPRYVDHNEIQLEDTQTGELFLIDTTTTEYRGKYTEHINIYRLSLND